MKKLLRNLLAAAVAVISVAPVAAAAAPALWLGYCDETVKTPGSSTISGVDINVSAAIYMTYEQLTASGADRISAVRVGLGPDAQYLDRLTQVTAWVRRELTKSDADAVNLTSGTITSGIVIGWNEITLDEPYVLQPGEGLYIGYTYTQSDKTNAVASTKGSHPSGSCWMKTLPSAAWKDYTTRGALYIQAGLDGDAIPRYNLTMGAVNTPGAQFGEDPLEAEITVTNNGAEVNTSFSVEASLEGSDQVYTIPVQGHSLRNSESLTTTIQIPFAGLTLDQSYTATLRVKDLNGSNADERPDDNVVTTTFTRLGEKFKRNCLVEEFTGEACGYCPGAARSLASVLASLTDAQRARISEAVHHAGYSPDWLTIAASTSYTQFYGGSTWAPSFMINRSEVKGSNNDKGIATSGYGSLKEWILTELAADAPVRLNVEANLTSATQLAVKVTVERMGNITPYLTVFVTEDNILASNNGAGQASGGSNWVHQHVLRAVNTTWGVPMPESDWNADGEFVYEHTFNVPTTWKPEDLKVVAFAHNLTLINASKIDPYGCQVLNSAHTAYPDFLSGIESVETDQKAMDADAPTEYYNLQGVRLGQPQPGQIVIVRQGSRAQKVRF